MKKSITGPLILLVFGLGTMAIFPAYVHLSSPNLPEKIGYFIAPLICPLAGMTWLMLRLMKQE